ncbi:MAG: DUF503 domain-containing protein [Synergistetes bacterium]|nr:DUF503 domain-containing protein [Synergistota bacterium]
MFVYGLYIRISIPYSHSLKEKRMVVRSLIERLRSRMGVYGLEVGEQDVWQSSAIGMSWTSISSTEGKNKLQSIIDFMEDDGRFRILEFDWKEIKLGK